MGLQKRASMTPTERPSFSRSLATVEELEELLIRADLGVDTAARIAEAIAQGRYDKQVSDAEVKAILSAEVEKVLAPVAKPLAIDTSARPFVVLVVGGK